MICNHLYCFTTHWDIQLLTLNSKQRTSRATPLSGHIHSRGSTNYTQYNSRTNINKTCSQLRSPYAHMMWNSFQNNV